MLISEKIRMYREFRGLNQIQLAELARINVGTIRKYETNVRKPKPDQLEKIAKALGLNVSVFFDFKLETAGDIMSLLFAIDDAVDLKLSGKADKEGKHIAGSVGIQFDKAVLDKFLKEWADFKVALAKANVDASSETDPYTREAELNKNAELYKEWKLRKMGTDVNSSMVVAKGTDGIVVNM